ncbi:MAG: N-acetylmuramoyl-L-alanine amidase [Prevotella sp.]|nr:N-acetylmuramoyl-L-alanine amidase [Prevotella sp.]
MVKRIILFLLLLLCCTWADAADKRKFTLVIDAGHGGKDAGALGKRLKEKDINLNVALAFGRYVENNCPDVRVIYTRKTDVFIPLHERASIANKNKADVFISIHTNSVASKKPVSGLETYTMGMRRSDEKLSAAMRENDVVLIESDYKQHYSGFDPRSPESYIIFEVLNDANMVESVELAKAIQKNVCRTANRPDKGVKQDAFLVLRETSMPACLVELGYITTASEETYLGNRQNIDALGRGIYQAFVEYKNKHTGTPPKAVPAKQAPAKQEPVAQEPAPAKQEPKPEAPQPDVAEQAPAAPAPVKADTVKAENVGQEEPDVPAPQAEEAPVFKVQFMTSDRQLKAGDSRMKGLTGVDSYKDGAVWKFTVGASTDYNEIRSLRREVAQKFPQAFIVAFKNGERMDTQAAIQEYREKSKK